MHRRSVFLAYPAAAACIFLSMPLAVAMMRQVEVPMEFSARYVKDQALEQVFTDGENRARVWDDGSGCNFLILSEPEVTTSSDGVRFSSPAEGRTGKPVGDRCLFLVEWRGIVEVDERPRVDDEGTAIVFEIVDSRLLDEQGNRKLSGVIWDWTKQYVHPRLQAIRLDANPALAELRYFLPLFLPQADADSLAGLLASVKLSSVATGSAGIAANLSFQVPAGDSDAPVAEEQPALEAAELEGLDLALKQFDAFITFVVKHAAFSTRSSAHRDELLDILLDARHALLESATSEGVTGGDPVRVLFVDTWRRIAPILRTISHDLPGKHALNFLSFIAAADALKGIDALGPSIGLEISTDALRRMARLMSPEAEGDPLEYNEQVDPAIRDAFEFGAPLTQPPPPTPPPSSSSWLIPNAWAASDQRRADLDRLNRWLPRREELSSYLLRVRILLEDTADDVLEAKPLESRFRDVFRPLVLATAWQESCWRQFVNKDGKRWPIRSRAGAVGMMQVMPRVWRGFYDPHSLSWDMAYNAGAGSEILRHYLVKYAIGKDEHGKTGELHNLARATYSIYNGGPRQLTRYRDSKAGKRTRRVDQSFWKKYQLIRDGNYLAVRECYS